MSSKTSSRLANPPAKRFESRAMPGHRSWEPLRSLIGAGESSISGCPRERSLNCPAYSRPEKCPLCADGKPITKLDHDNVVSGSSVADLQIDHLLRRTDFSGFQRQANARSVKAESRGSARVRVEVKEVLSMRPGAPTPRACARTGRERQTTKSIGVKKISFRL